MSPNYPVQTAVEADEEPHQNSKQLDRLCRAVPRGLTAIALDRAEKEMLRFVVPLLILLPGCGSGLYVASAEHEEAGFTLEELACVRSIYIGSPGHGISVFGKFEMSEANKSRLEKLLGRLLPDLALTDSQESADAVVIVLTTPKTVTTHGSNLGHQEWAATVTPAGLRSGQFRALLLNGTSRSEGQGLDAFAHSFAELFKKTKNRLGCALSNSALHRTTTRGIILAACTFIPAGRRQ